MKKKRDFHSRKKKHRPEKRAGLSSEYLLELMKHEDRPMLLREILRRLGLPKEQRLQARDFLKKLADEGKVVRIRGNRYGLASKMNLVVGRIKAHPDGYGFVIPEAEGEADIFIGHRSFKDAMHGDRVVARVESVRRKGREGSVIRVLERKTRKVVGKFMKSENYSYIVPEDERISQEVFIPEGETKRARQDQIVVAEITRYPAERTGLVGKITHILGFPGDPDVEPQIIIHKYDLPHRFASAALKEARGIPPAPSPHEMKDRVDLRSLPTVTIDGESAKDFDDAVSIEEEGDGGVKLYVSIADVGHYVQEGTALDEEAYLRGTSVYFPDRAVPMLPPEISNEICSLKPKVERLTLTVELRYDRNGESRGVRFYPSVIRSDARLTYTLVRKILVDRDESLRLKFSSLLPSLERMAGVFRELRRRRIGRGALDFDLPEPEVVLNLQGETEEIIRAERNMAHQIIEEFMIAANEAVARFMEEKGVPSIYRVHEPPKKEAMDEFRRFLTHLGYKVKKTLTPSTREIQGILAGVQGKPEERVVNAILLRSMKWAKYSAQNAGHFGLASECYTHFTSPIRRYPDLIVHRILRRALSGEKIKTTEEILAGQAEHLSGRERVAMEAEREILNRYRVRFMKDKVGEEFDGVISGVTAFGFFVELKDIFVEGLVRVTGLHDDYYQYHEEKYCLIGERTHKAFRTGDPIRVSVERVDVEKRHIDFGLIQKADGVKR